MTTLLFAAFVIICGVCWLLALSKMLTLARRALPPHEPVQVPRCFGCGREIAASAVMCGLCLDRDWGEVEA